jgi:hypothetical protein
MTAIIKVSPLQKDKFKHVLELSNQLRIITGVNITSEGDDFFEIEYSKEQYLFNLGRAFEPYKMDLKAGSITIGYDNSYLHKILQS